MRIRGLFTLIFLIFTLIVLALPAWAAQPAVLEGFLDYGTDVNNNGVFDHLSADITINVNEPGKYRIDGEILIRKNLKEFETIVYTSGDYSLVKGIQLVTINFPGGQIREKGKDGPYFLNVLLNKDAWKSGGPLGETRRFKASEFEESDEIITTGKVTRKSQAIALVEAKAQELNLKLGNFQSLSFNGQWNLVFANPASKEPFKFVIGSDGEVKYLGVNPPASGQVSPPGEATKETPPPPVESKTEEPGKIVADPTQVTEDKEEVKEEPTKEPAQEKAPAEPRSEKEGKLDKPGNVPVWPFIVTGFVFFLILGFISEIKARYR